MMNKHLLKSFRLIPIILIIFVALIIIPKVALSQNTSIRPIEDFVNAQGTFCSPDGMGGCLLFIPPIENFLGMSDPAAGLLASVDYAGLADDWLGGSLGTEFDGTVIERPLADGRAQVRVILHTSNALTWVVEGDDFATSPLIFGYRAPDVASNTPGLADSHLNLVFINSAPGAPLPDLMQILVEQFENLRFLSFKATANGPLRELFGVIEGTPGKVVVTETGLFTTHFMAAVADGFPVERIKVQEVGN
jgi:hypothetical protein